MKHAKGHGFSFCLLCKDSIQREQKYTLRTDTNMQSGQLNELGPIISAFDPVRCALY